MALTFAKVTVEANALVDLSNRMATLLADVTQVLTHNSNQAIDWGAGNGSPGNGTPAYITEDAAFNISGFTFTRQAVANAIGSLTQFQRLLTNLSASQGDHLGNLNQLARPLG